MKWTSVRPRVNLHFIAFMHINDLLDAFVLHGEVEVIVAMLSIVFQTKRLKNMLKSKW